MRTPGRVAAGVVGAATLFLIAGPSPAQTIRDLLGSDGNPLKSSSRSTPAPARPAAAPAPSADSGAAAQLSQSNRDLLDLLKKQQSVLEDIQYDRRLQNRQIQLVEERLEESLQQNTELQTRIARLEGELADAKAAAEAKANGATPGPAGTPAPESEPIAPTEAPEPETYLPPVMPEGAPGTMWWHRVTMLSGTDSKTSGLFHIQGRQWRVLWHNQDRAGDSYKNTSALFVNAFPKDDTIPQKVCSKLGSGGDETDLPGPGNFYLKVEASGGKWELAVEEMR